MTVNVNGENRFFSDNVLKFDEKYDQKIKIWYFIFSCLNIANIWLFIRGIHQLSELLFFLPFFHILIVFVYAIIRYIKLKPNGDELYIKTYYPAVARTLQIDEYKYTLAWHNFEAGDYIDSGKDPIIDNIRERLDERKVLFRFPIILCFIVWILSFIVIVVTET